MSSSSRCLLQVKKDFAALSNYQFCRPRNFTTANPRVSGTLDCCRPDPSIRCRRTISVLQNGEVLASEPPK